MTIQFKRRPTSEKKGFKDALEMIVDWIKANPKSDLKHLKWLLESSLTLNDAVEERLDELEGNLIEHH